MQMIQNSLRFLKALLPKKRMKQKHYSAADIVAKVFYFISWIVLFVLAISMLMMPLWMILNAFKDPIEDLYNTNIFAFPETFRWENFTAVFKFFEFFDFNIMKMIGVSVLMSTVKPFLIIYFTTCWAYIIAKYKFIGAKFWYTFGIILMVLPVVGTGAAAMRINVKLGIYDNLFMNIITGPSGGFSGMNFLIMYAAFKALPWDYAESVSIEGGGFYTIFFKIYFVMVIPNFMVLMVLSFMTAWNEWQGYMIWLPSYPNIAYGMYLFNQKANSLSYGTKEVLAGFTIAAIPTVLLYLGTQKVITSKFIVGGLKG